MFGMHPAGGMWSWWMGGWGWLWCLVAVAVLVAAAVWVASRAGNGSGGSMDRSHIDTLRILEGRLARGEIDQAEFAARRSALRDHDA